MDEPESSGDELHNTLRLRSANDCPKCGHDFGGHTLVVVDYVDSQVNGTIPGGGVIYCLGGCDCYAKWSAQGNPDEWGVGWVGLFRPDQPHEAQG